MVQGSRAISGCYLISRHRFPCMFPQLWPSWMNNQEMAFIDRVVYHDLQIAFVVNQGLREKARNKPVKLGVKMIKD